jgi:hypothetical protein
MAKAKIKPPSGLTTTRNGGTFQFTWKRNNNYSKQRIQYYNRLTSKWVEVTIAPKTTAIHKWFDLNTKYRHIDFRVCAYYNGRWCSWVQLKWTADPPNKPFAGHEKGDLPNVGKFTWNVVKSDTDKKPFSKIEWQSVLLKESSITNGADVIFDSKQYGWRTGTSTANEGSVDIQELTGDVTEGSSATRWFRVRSIGYGGESDWNYAKRVYANPKPITIKTATLAQQTAASYSCSISWNAYQDATRPITKATVYYSVAVPAEDMSFPGGASWTEASTSADSAGTDYSVFTIPEVMAKDEVVFVKVNASYEEGTETEGEVAIAGYGELKSPTDLSPSIVPDYTYNISATNTSEVPDSFLAVVYESGDKPSEQFVIGIIPHDRSSVIVQCPHFEKAPKFGVYAVAGTYKAVARQGGVTSYDITPTMRSKGIVWGGGTIPTAPENVTVTASPITGTAHVTWEWTWADADSAVIAWADHEDAWESTDAPDEFTVSRLNAPKWNISGLATGKTWYIAVKLMSEDTSGAWSTPIPIVLTSAPAIPVLTPSSNVISVDSDLTLNWSYVSTDGTGQSYAEICEATIDGNGNITYGKIIAHTGTEQQITIKPRVVGWSAGQKKNLCVRVASASGRKADSWSEPIDIIIADKVEAEIVSTSLVNGSDTYSYIDGDGETQTETRTFLELDEMPLTVAVSGAGEGGETTVTIQRNGAYHLDRPDENDYYGYDGETIATATVLGEAVNNNAITFTVPSLIGQFDDSAHYTLIATVKDGYGRTDSKSLDFEVHWAHQASAPSDATVEIDEANLIAKLTVTAPEDAVNTDVVDIYRLSADKPELIVSDGSFGELYVDPYPAINGGYRFVTRTANGDYITPDDMIASLDVDTEWDYDRAIIDFGGQQVQLYYNLDLSNSWEKSFHATRYLGGSIKGDWDAGVNRTATLSTVAFTEYNADVIDGLRDLAEYTGICHIRTLDGSSFSADLQVQEDRDHDDYGSKASFSISGTRVDPEGEDGLLYSDWYVPEV